MKLRVSRLRESDFFKAPQGSWNPVSWFPVWNMGWIHQEAGYTTDLNGNIGENTHETPKITAKISQRSLENPWCCLPMVRTAIGLYYYIDCDCAGASHSPMSIRKTGRILQVSAPEQFGTSVPYSILPRMRENFHEFSITADRYSIFICFYIFICSFCTVGRTARRKIYCGSMEGWSTVMRMSFQEWWFPNTSNGSDHSNVPVILCVVVQFCSFSHNLIQNMVSIQQKSSLSGGLNKKTGGVFLEPYVFLPSINPPRTFWTN